MCNDVDLFGEVVITYDDVEKFLRSIPRLVDGARYEAVKSYVITYDVVNKIKRMKLDNSFYSLNDLLLIDNQKLSPMLHKLLKPKFKASPIIPLSMLSDKRRPAEMRR